MEKKLQINLLIWSFLAIFTCASGAANDDSSKNCYFDFTAEQEIKRDWVRRAEIIGDEVLAQDLIPLVEPSGLLQVHLIEKIKKSAKPNVLRQKLVNILEQLNKQQKLMEIISQIAEEASSSFTLQEACRALVWEVEIATQYLLNDFANNIPQIVSVKLQFKTEWLERLRGTPKEFSDSLLRALHETGIPECVKFAQNFEMRKLQNTHFDRIESLFRELMRKFTQRNFIFDIEPIECLTELEQPGYFAFKVISFLKDWIPVVMKYSSKDDQLKHSLQLQRYCIQVREMYEKYEEAFSALKFHIQQEIDRIPVPSFIDDIIKRQQAQLKPGKKKQGGRGRTKKAQGRATSVHPGASSGSIQETAAESSVVSAAPAPSSKKTVFDRLPVSTVAAAAGKLGKISIPSSGSCSAPCSSTDISISGASAVSHQQAVDLKISETVSTVRIRDEKHAMTIELFKPETTNARSVQNCVRTDNVKSWLIDSQDALRKFGYLDPEHKNFTPEKINRVRMEQYHGFSSNADKFVSKCGISKEYRKPNGQVHIMICMPGVLYFVDETHQLGIFTYLIDPKTNQLYHRMFHPCSGDKIVKEYTEYGYWDIDPNKN